MPSVPKIATLANRLPAPLQSSSTSTMLENLKSLVPEEETATSGTSASSGSTYRVEGDHWRSTGAMMRGLDAARASGNTDQIAQGAHERGDRSQQF
jgi:hypothetical protein